MKDMGLNVLSKPTTTTYFKKFRGICSNIVKKNKIQLGGENRKVEVDESNFKKKAKNNVRRAIKMADKWVQYTSLIRSYV